MAQQQQLPVNSTAAINTATSTTPGTASAQPAATADGTEDYSAQWAAYYR